MTSKSPVQHSILKQLLMRLGQLEEAFLVLLLLVMILVAVAQIMLRNFFSSGLLWADPLVRSLLLWVGLWGAMLASRHNQHIAIDFSQQWLAAGPRRALQRLIMLIAGLLCALLAYQCWRFLRLEYLDNSQLYGQFPAWIVQLIMPFAFTLMSLRCFILALLDPDKLPPDNSKPL